MKTLNKICNSFKIAFAMYSKIPMPRSQWTKENMRYVICFFPLVGTVIGFLSYIFLMICKEWEILQNSGLFFITTLMVVIPVFVTGGIHLDGLLDTTDALSSYQEKERRLEILKDPCAGAFAIITCVVYFILYLGIYSFGIETFMKDDSLLAQKMIMILGITFMMSRAFSGLSIVTFPMAKNTGLVTTFSDGAQKKVVKTVMILYILTLSAIMMWIHPVMGIGCMMAVLVVFGYYRWMSLKMFGGITGDLCGWFLQIAELAMAFVVILIYVIKICQ